MAIFGKHEETMKQFPTIKPKIVVYQQRPGGKYEVFQNVKYNGHVLSTTRTISTTKKRAFAFAERDLRGQFYLKSQPEKTTGVNEVGVIWETWESKTIGRAFVQPEKEFEFRQGYPGEEIPYKEIEEKIECWIEISQNEGSFYTAKVHATSNYSEYGKQEKIRYVYECKERTPYLAFNAAFQNCQGLKLCYGWDDLNKTTIIPTIEIVGVKTKQNYLGPHLKPKTFTPSHWWNVKTIYRDAGFERKEMEFSKKIKEQVGEISFSQDGTIQTFQNLNL